MLSWIACWTYKYKIKCHKLLEHAHFSAHRIYMIQLLNDDFLNFLVLCDRLFIIIIYFIGLLNSYLHSDCKRGWVIPKWKIVLRLISMLHIYHGFYYFGFRRIDLNDLLATRTFCHHLITHFLVEILANLRGSLSFLL